MTRSSRRRLLVAASAFVVAIATPAVARGGESIPASQPAPPSSSARGGSLAHGLGGEVVAGVFGVAAAAVGALVARRRSAAR